MKYIRKFLPAIIFTAVFAVLWLFYATAYKYHFFLQEQNQLFLFDSGWIATYFGKPAWLASLAGEFLTQFYYYVGVGPVILSAVIALTAWALYSALDMLRGRGLRLLIAVVLAGWMASCSLASSCHLNALLAVTIGILCYMVVRGAGVWGVAVIPVAWWLGGYGCMFTAALLMLGAFTAGARRGVIVSAVSVALVLLTPAVLMRAYTLHYSAALTWPDIPAPSAPESEYEAVLSVDNEFYFGNLDKAARLAQEVDSANSVTAFYYYLSQARRDSLPDCLLRYPVKDLGTLNTIGESSPMSVINMMNDLYYELGDMMYAERAAMMRNVFSSQNRNARMIKRLAEINLVSGDTVAALKHLRILSKTLPYRAWAAAHMPGSMSAAAEAEILARRERVNAKDTLRIGDNCRVILLELLDSNPANTVALDYLLCTDLLLKDMDSFKSDYDRYCMDTGRPRLKPLYQQALMIYLAGTDAPDDEWPRYIASPTDLSRFRQYSRQRRDPSFADTYWYYFDTH